MFICLHLHVGIWCRPQPIHRHAARHSNNATKNHNFSNPIALCAYNLNQCLGRQSWKVNRLNLPVLATVAIAATGSFDLGSISGVSASREIDLVKASSIFVGVSPCHSTDTLMHCSVEKSSSRSVSRSFSTEKYIKASPINISSYNMRGIHGMESTCSLSRMT